MRNIFIFREDGSKYFLNIILAGAVTIVATRLFLELTGYPQLGGGDLHIAHLLWGGLFLFSAISIILVFKGKHIKSLGSYLAGIGWGLFIDELGKFITSDNNYFYKPAAPLIYLLFLLLFTAFYYLNKPKKTNTKTLLYSVSDQIAEIIEGDFDPDEKEKLIKKLDYIIDHSKEQSEIELARDLAVLVKKQTITSDKPSLNRSFAQKSLDKLIVSLKKVTNKTWFNNFFITLISARFTWGLLSSLGWIVIATNKAILPDSIWLSIFPRFDISNSTEVLLFVIMIGLKAVVGILLLVSLAKFFNGKRGAIRFAKYALIFSIVFVNLSEFYFNQFSAVITSLTDLAFFMIIREYEQRK